MESNGPKYDDFSRWENELLVSEVWTPEERRTNRFKKPGGYEDGEYRAPSQSRIKLRAFWFWVEFGKGTNPLPIEMDDIVKPKPEASNAEKSEPDEDGLTPA